MIELASENGAVLAAGGEQTLVRAGLDRMQHENDLENVAKRCETSHSPASETCQSTPAIDSPPAEDET